MGTVVLDSSVVIAFVNEDDAHHRTAVSELRAARWRDDELVLPVTVLSESLVGAHRAGAGFAADMSRRLLGLFGPARPPDVEIADMAARLRARVASLRLPDALVIATGVVDDAVVLTCDRRMSAVDPRVQVIGG